MIRLYIDFCFGSAGFESRPQRLPPANIPHFLWESAGHNFNMPLLTGCKCLQIPHIASWQILETTQQRRSGHALSRQPWKSRARISLSQEMEGGALFSTQSWALWFNEILGNLECLGYWRTHNRSEFKDGASLVITVKILENIQRPVFYLEHDGS